MMSMPMTVAPPSMTASKTWAISGVHMTFGTLLNGSRRYVSSSIAITTAGDSARSYCGPNTAWRSQTRLSADNPSSVFDQGPDTATVATKAATAEAARVFRWDNSEPDQARKLGLVAGLRERIYIEG